MVRHDNTQNADLWGVGGVTECWGSVVGCRECVEELVLDGRQIESKTVSKTISDFNSG